MEYIYYQEIPETDVLNGIMELHKHVFEGAELKLEELTEKKNLLIFVAIDSDRVVGFKIGYEFNDYTFYSWLGGVHSDYRGKGVASELMRRQHEKIKSLGYPKVRTISRNKRRAMLILNIKFGFDVVETFISKKGHIRLCWRKSFNKN